MLAKIAVTHPLSNLTSPWSLDHVALAVHDLNEGERPYRLLGLARLGEDEIVPSQHVRVRLLQLGNGLLELLEPTSPESPIASFLEKRGPGLHHLAFRVADLEAELKRLAAAGAQLIDASPRPGRAGSKVAFLHPKWAGGVLIELVEHG
jgi:methylmalonyl-CoA/ethylmalonyl-CoA epimerase